MNVIPVDEVDVVRHGDYIYRRERTYVLGARYVITDEANPAPPGIQYQEIVAEELDVVTVAVIDAAKFRVYWCPAPCSEPDVPVRGWLVKNEIIARKLFPMLLAYRYGG